MKHTMIRCVSFLRPYYLFVIICCCMAGGEVQAQHFTKKMLKYVRSEQDRPERISIGLMDAPDKYCYEWFSLDANNPLMITSEDLNAKRVELLVDAETTQVAVRWLTSDGYKEDHVTVILKNSAQILSVTTYRPCFIENEPVVMSDFRIVTDPEGYEELVTCTSARIPKSSQTTPSPEMLLFQLPDGHGHISEEVLDIDVYDAPEESQAGSTNLEYQVVINMLNTLMSEYILVYGKEIVKSAKRFGGVLKSLSPFSLVINFIPPNVRTTEVVHTCCDYGPMHVFREIAGNNTYGGGFQGTVPLGIPGVATLNAMVTCTVNHIVSAYSVLVPCDVAQDGSIQIGDISHCHGDIRIPGRNEFNLKVSAGGDIGAGVLSASTGVQVSYICPTIWDRVHKPVAQKQDAHWTVGIETSTNFFWVPQGCTLDFIKIDDNGISWDPSVRN